MKLTKYKIIRFKIINHIQMLLLNACLYLYKTMEAESEYLGKLSRDV